MTAPRASPQNPDPDGGPSPGVTLAPGISVAAPLVRWAFSRSGGPGGQNVNKLATKAELRIEIDDLPIGGRAKHRLRALAGRRAVGVETVVDALGRAHERGGDLVITSESERSQGRNRSECLEKLRALIVEAMAEPRPRRKTRPTRSSVERRIGEKKRRSDIKRGRGERDQ